MGRKRLARWLVVSALACLGLALGAGSVRAQEDQTTVQGTQSSDNPTAETGASIGENDNSLRGGPSSTAPTDASSSQIGDNSAAASQSGSAASGDPIAGAQVVGAVADNVTAQNQNSATGASAVSGPVAVTNSGDIRLGPVATVGSGGSAQAAQTGSNALELVHEASAVSGDAIAGSQVTGIVGGGEHTVQNQNVAECDEGPCAVSGTSTASNDVAFALGPVAIAEYEAPGTIGTAQAGQIGDNDAVLSQSVVSRTGDALFGSQVTGVVGGSAAVQNQNSSTGARDITSRSGDATGFNTAASVFDGPSAGPVATARSTAQATQTGNNSVDVAQGIEIGSGDALSGAQVTGAVGDQSGHLEVQNQQASEDDSAVSGTSVGINVIFTGAGPAAFAEATGLVDASSPTGVLVGTDGSQTASASQIGDNDVTFAQSVGVDSGDAIAGAQVTGDVGHQDVTVQNQSTADGPYAESGGVVASNLGFAVAGPFAGAFAEFAISLEDIVIDSSCGPPGPFPCTGEPFLVDATGVAGGQTAQATQNGDNTLTATVDVTAASGDAVAGGQITGIVSTDAGDVDVQNQSDTENGFAVTGDVAVVDVFGLNAGPIAQSSANVGVHLRNVDIDASAFCPAPGAGQNCTATGGDVTITGTGAAGGQDAQASQVGDNAVAAAVDVAAASGDAVAGGQVTGVVTGDASEVDVQNQNSDDASSAASGGVSLIEEGFVQAGPVANASLDLGVSIEDVTIDTSAKCASAPAQEATCTVRGGNVTIGGFGLGEGQNAQSEQIGDNAVLLDTSISANSGDAVAGGQVTGVVAGDASDITAQQQNEAEGSNAVTGPVFALSGTSVNAGPEANANANIGVAILGDLDIVAEAECHAASTGTCTATGGSVSLFGAGLGGDQTAQAQQNGDNAVDTVVVVDAASGDAVAGSQVTGAVTGDESVVTVQKQNDAESTRAVTGRVDAHAEADINAGPSAQASANAFLFVEKERDNEVDIDVSARCSAASEGVCAAFGGDVTFGADGLTGDQSAHAQQIGDNNVSAATLISAASGDAVSGSQVTGVVAGDGSDVTAQNQNQSEDAFAFTGVVGASSSLDVTAGPNATAGDAFTFVGDIAFDIDNTEQCTGPGLTTCVAGTVSIVDPLGTTDTSEAGAQQTGDNAVDLASDVQPSSGDAVSGTQVTGIVGSGSDADARSTGVPSF